MKLIEQLKAKIESIGGGLDEYEQFFHLDTPSGYVWRSNGNTSMLITFSNGSETWLVKAIKDEMDNIQMGLVRETDPKRIAEICHLLDNDEWAAPDGSPDFIAWPK